MAEGDRRDSRGKGSRADDPRQFRIQSGPLPPPEVLREYEEQFPGLAKHLIRMAELEQEIRLRQELEVERVAAAKRWMERARTLLFFVSMLIGVVMGVFLTAEGFGTPAAVLLATLLVTSMSISAWRM